MPPDLLAELAQIDGIEAVKQANCDELQLIDGLGGPRRQRRHLRALPGASAAPAASASPRTSSATRCAGCTTSRTRARRSTRRCRRSTRRCSSPPAPRPVKAALKMLGHDAGPLRLPLVECDETERDARARRARPPRAARGGHRRGERHSSASSRSGGVGEIGKNLTVVEYDGRIVVVDCGLRFPTAEMMGIDLVLPDFTYLREQRRRDRGDRHHPRPRGPSRRAAVGDPRPRPGQDPGRLRRPADDRDGALQARRAQAARRQPRGAADRRHRRGRPVRARAHPPHALDPGRQRRRAHDAARAPSSSPATTSSTRRRSAARRPTWRGWPSSAASGLLLLCGDSTNVDRPGISRERVDRRPAPGPRVRALRGPDRRHLLRVEHPPRPAGRARGREANGRKVALVGRSMRKNVNIGRSLGHIDIPEGMLRAAARDRPVGRREDRRHLHRLPGRAAVGAAPDGLPRPPAGGAQARRHAWSSARRRSRATSARSTRRSTGSTTSAARS